MKKKNLLTVFIIAFLAGAMILFQFGNRNIGVINSSIVSNVATPETKNITETKNVTTPVYHTIFKFITEYLPFKERAN